MTDLEKADDRIQAICDKIRTETLDPAKERAQEIIEHAKKEAMSILHQANSEAEQLIKDTRKSLEEEKQIFQSSLHQASKQTIELLKQKIEQKLFNPVLDQWVKTELKDAKGLARLIEVVIKAIDKEGLKAELSVKIPESYSADEINAQLSKSILERLTNHSVELSDIQAGVQVKLVGKNMVLDLTSGALEEIVATFIRKDFRKVFFGN